MPVNKMPVAFIPVKRPEQIQEIAGIAKITWTEHYTSLIGSAQVAYMIEKFQSVSAITNQIQQGYRYYLIQFDGQAAGYISILLQPMEKSPLPSGPMEKSLFLSKFYVEKPYRGRHIATQTIAFIKEICKKEELHKIWLTANKQNRSSLEVYEHLGFTRARDVITDIGEGYVMDDYIMEVII